MLTSINTVMQMAYPILYRSHIGTDERKNETIFKSLLQLLSVDNLLTILYYDIFARPDETWYILGMHIPLFIDSVLLSKCSLSHLQSKGGPAQIVPSPAPEQLFLCVQPSPRTAEPVPTILH